MKITLGTLSAALVVALMVVTPPALAGNGNGNNGNGNGGGNGSNGNGNGNGGGNGSNGNGNGNGHNISGAPGPIAGAGLPVLAIGYGVYWLVKRRRKANDI
jgi:hypothetical protein